jgi:hypothetical protein
VNDAARAMLSVGRRNVATPAVRGHGVATPVPVGPSFELCEPSAALVASQNGGYHARTVDSGDPTDDRKGGACRFVHVGVELQRPDTQAELALRQQ